MASISVEIPLDETIQKVAKEGLEARNLVNWISDGTFEDVKTSKKPPTSPRPQSVSPKPTLGDTSKMKDFKFPQTSKRRTTLSRPKNRLRSASAGRNPEKDLRTRYWTFLFENLHRAVDEIYQTCEMDESIVESKEAIMMLENYSKDFHALIQYININKDYEKTAPPNRPTSLAWEVRKSSPGKSLLKNVFIEKLTAGNCQAKRVLCFDSSINSSGNEGNNATKISSRESPIQTETQAVLNEENSSIESSINKTEILNQKNVIANPCDIKISIVDAQSFPCNQDLVVKEVHCLSEKPSTIFETEKEFSSIDVKNETLITDETEKINNLSDLAANELVQRAVKVSDEISDCQPSAVNGTEKKHDLFSDLENEKSVTDNSVKENDEILSCQVSMLNETEKKSELENNEILRGQVSILNETEKKSDLENKKSVTENSVKENNEILRGQVSMLNKTEKKSDLSSDLTNKESMMKNDLKASDEISCCQPAENELMKENKQKVRKSVSKLDHSTEINNKISNKKIVSNGPISTEKKLPASKVKIFRKNVNEKIALQGVVKTNVADVNVSVRRDVKAADISTKGDLTPKEMPKMKTTEKAATKNSSSLNASKTARNGMDASMKSKSIADRVAAGAGNAEKVSPPLKSASHKITNSKGSISKDLTNATDKKPLKTNHSESAIKRNISYVSALSSRNQLSKPVNAEKKRPCRTISHAVKLPQKSGSMSALNKISSKSWVMKTLSVEQIPETVKANLDEDSDGWEMVRGRNRCRNSPAKKIPYSNEKKEKEAAQIAKMNQSRIGGFPYSTKNSSRTPLKGPQKSSVESQKNQKIKESKSIKKEDVKVCKQDNLLKNSEQMSTVSDSVNKENIKQLSKVNKYEVHPQSDFKDDKSEDLKPIITKDSLLRKQAIKSEDFDRNTELNALKLDLMTSFDNEVSNEANHSNSNRLRRSSSVPDISANSSNLFNSMNSLCNSDDSLCSEKDKFMFSSAMYGKSIKLPWKRNGKIIRSFSNDTSRRINYSLDGSDNGLTSDDQDGHTSHDEAFDISCQELNDAEWKYKILSQQVHKLELSWGDQMDLFDMELRTPGRALEMHEKLSSPFRKKSLLESIRLCNEKQLKAQEQRKKLLVEKSRKYKDIEKKRLEMKALLEQKQEKQRILMEQKLERAEEKRKKRLQMIIRKAHDEEEKVNEIAFINSLEAQNKRHDLISKEKDHEARLHDIQEERQRRQEEKAAKEAAAEERRKILEAERQARLNEMQEKRKLKDHKVEQLFLVKEKERQELANQKARDRELRISAMNAQQQISIEELQKKIQLKQEESARRHEENMEQIRQKAFELSIRKCSSNNDDVPQPVPYKTKKICTMCNVLIGSEVYLLSHLRGKKHQEAVKEQYQDKDPSAEELELYNLKHIVDASTDQLDPNIALDKERQKALKKRCKKLRQRMSNRGQEYESQLEKNTDSNNSNSKSKLVKCISDLKKLITLSNKSINDNNVLSSLERHLNEIDSVLEKKLDQDKKAFKTIGGISVLIDVFNILLNTSTEKSTFMHKKIMNHVSSTAVSVVENCFDNSVYILFSNKIGSLLDSLNKRLSVLMPDNCNHLTNSLAKTSGLSIQIDSSAGHLLHVLAYILTALSAKNNQLASFNNNEDKSCQKENKPDELQIRVQDAISYIVSIGIVDKLSQYFHIIQGPISNEVEVATFLLHCIEFLTALIKLYSDCFTSSQSGKTDDSTQLIATFKVTNMIGAVSLLYGLLLHNGASSRSETPPSELPKEMETLAFSTLCMLNHIAVMNLQAFQTILGGEGLSLQVRHITSHLLWYCSHWTSDKLLHEVILLIGYFTVLNTDNQYLIQAGQRPTVLQQLCSLPFLYFSDEELTDILFPTLIACCYNNSSNKTILEQEMSSELLSNYIEVKYMNVEEFSCNKKVKNAISKRWLFSSRFPKSCWSSAKQYFSVTET